LKKFSFLVVVLVFVFTIVSCGADTKRPKDDSENTGNDDVEQNDDDNSEEQSDNVTQTDEEQKDDIVNDEDNSGSVCGNNITESGEECDGNVVDCVDIDSSKYTGGKARCKKDCSGFDDITCDFADDYCGDDKVVFPEVCDGGSVSCTSINPSIYSGGDAPCKDDCTGYDVSDCEIVEAECGDGKVEGAEVCEKDDIEDCVNIDSSKFSGGKARCEKDCSGWDTITCDEKTEGLFSDGFESGDSAWELTGDFEVGFPSYDVNGVTLTVAKSGSWVLGTVLDGNYTNEIISEAFTASKVDIPVSGTHVLKFWAYANTDFDSDGTTGAKNYFDGMIVVYKFGDEAPTQLEVTAEDPDLVGDFQGYEGSSYNYYDGVRGTSSNNTYALFTVDLSKLSGSSAYIGFKFFSDTVQAGEGSFPGVYIDDVEIVEE
jgi:hypothetical protein